jgi:hypothetical protein
VPNHLGTVSASVLPNQLEALDETAKLDPGLEIWEKAVWTRWKAQRAAAME